MNVAKETGPYVIGKIIQYTHEARRAFGGKSMKRPSFNPRRHMHVDDAAQAFVGVIGKENTIGKTYNLVNRGYITWADYHRMAMNILNQDCELVGVPFADLKMLNVPDFEICEEIFAHHVYYSSEQLFRDVPEFHPQISLETGMAQVFEHMQREIRIPDSDSLTWEDEIIARQRRILE